MDEELLLVDGEELLLEHDHDANLADNENEAAPSSSEVEEVSEVGASAFLSETSLQGGTQLNLLRNPKKMFPEFRKKWMVKETFMLLKLALPLVSVASVYSCGEDVAGVVVNKKVNVEKQLAMSGVLCFVFLVGLFNYFTGGWFVSLRFTLELSAHPY